MICIYCIAKVGWYRVWCHNKCWVMFEWFVWEKHTQCVCMVFHQLCLLKFNNPQNTKKKFGWMHRMHVVRIVIDSFDECSIYSLQERTSYGEIPRYISVQVMASVMSTLVKIHTQYIGNKLIREIYAQQLVMYWVSYTNYIREENTNKCDKRRMQGPRLRSQAAQSKEYKLNCKRKLRQLCKWIDSDTYVLCLMYVLRLYLLLKLVKM